MTAWNRDRTARLLHAAGRIALEKYNTAAHMVKQDHTLVTEADKAVETYLSGELEDEANNIRIIGEETFERKNAAYLDTARTSGEAWIIDPIDGTTAYANRIPMWGISIGYARDGVLLEGGIFIPCTGEMLISDNNAAYYAQAAAETADDYVPLLKQLEKPQTEFHESSTMFGLSQYVLRRAVCATNMNIYSMVSCVYPYILLATGRLGACMIRAKIWDHAGGLPALKALGFFAKSADGDNFAGDMKLTGERLILDYSAPAPFMLKENRVVAQSEEIEQYLRSNVKIIRD